MFLKCLVKDFWETFSIKMWFLYFLYLYALKMQNKFTQLQRTAISEGYRQWMSLPVSHLDIFAV